MAPVECPFLIQYIAMWPFLFILLLIELATFLLLLRLIQFLPIFFARPILIFNGHTTRILFSKDTATIGCQVAIVYSTLNIELIIESKLKLVTLRRHDTIYSENY